MPLRNFANFSFHIESSQERVAQGPQKRGALGHGVFGLCVNPSLPIPKPDVPVSSIISQPESSFLLASSNNVSGSNSANHDRSCKPLEKSKNKDENVESVSYEEIDYY